MTRTSSILLLLGSVLLLGGCSLGKPTQPSTFYVLSAEAQAPVSGRESPASPLSVGLGPVELPDLFDRPQIVTRPESNRIELAEYDRWGSDLNRELNRVLALNLMRLLNTDNVAPYPWQGSRRPDLRVSIRFFRFDGVPGERAVLDGVWRILDGDRGCELRVRRFHIEQSPAAAGYPAFVRAISAAVAELSREIATEVAVTKPVCSS